MENFKIQKKTEAGEQPLLSKVTANPKMHRGLSSMEPLDILSFVVQDATKEKMWYGS